MQIDKAKSLAQTGDISKYRVKNEDGTLSPFDTSRFKQSVRNALDSHENESDATLSVSELETRTFDALSQELGKNGTIDAHDIRTQIEMSLVLSSSNNMLKKGK